MTRRSNIPFSLTASEIADMRLAGLPKSKSQVNRRAETEGWRFDPRHQRGGGRLYLTDDLPLEAREDLRTRRRLYPDANASAPPMGRPKGSGFFDVHTDVADAVIKVLAERRLAAPRIMEVLAKDFGSLPSRRSLQRFIAKAEDEHAALLAKKRDPDGYKGRYRLALGRADADCTYAHEVWELDTTPADVILKDEAAGEGKTVRMAILGVIDRWSRRAKFVVVPTESAQAVRRTLTETMIEWGVMPAAVLTDNGSGYINETMRTALPLIGIDHRLCPPGTPEKKPHIERVFGTFTRERAELLDGYSGHNVADAQKLRAKAKKETGRAVVLAHLTADDLQRILNAWVDGVYHQRDHSTLRMSPMRKWMSSPVAPRAAPSEAKLKLCLSALVGVRTVGKKGIVWKNGSYWAAPLAAWMGREVMVRRDEDDLGALFIFSPDGDYIDTAINWERSGFSQAQFARAAKAQQAKWMAEQSAELKARTRNFDVDAARRHVLISDAEKAGKLSYLKPKANDAPIVNATSLQAPDNAPVALPDRPRSPRRDVSDEATRQQKIIANVERADRILANHASGHGIEPDDLDWARNYVSTSSYQTEKIMRAAFGDPRPNSDEKTERKVS